MNGAVAARPLRSDAAANLHRIHDAALAAFSSQGTDVSMEHIAQAAGVGVGTLYRRYPNKDALVDDLLRSILQELIDAAEAALRVEDGTGLETFLKVVGQSMLRHHGCAAQLFGRPKSAEMTEQLRTRYAELTEQAKTCHAIAAHVSVADVQMTMWAMLGVIGATATSDPHAWQRFLDTHLAGLRPN